MAVGVTWNTPKIRHEIITGAPNDDRGYNNALKELNWYKKTILYSVIHKAQFKKSQNTKGTSQRGLDCSRANGTDPMLSLTGQHN